MSLSLVFLLSGVRSLVLLPSVAVADKVLLTVGLKDGPGGKVVLEAECSPREGADEPIRYC